ncbi:hypothetical protein MM440_13085 [Arsenicicoccus piscis]|uniref:hypothetical protein n=1 Tax=Arsenicicoccus piscis TaxID=673954 RepID=UPI001F4CF209|nr:hypothetical protein [Arsenicicoccus piscis]MCH8628669.1 hypothetical protein [Arsenicicoccus piscis]
MGRAPGQHRGAGVAGGAYELYQGAAATPGQQPRQSHDGLGRPPVARVELDVAAPPPSCRVPRGMAHPLSVRAQ